MNTAGFRLVSVFLFTVVLGVDLTFGADETIFRSGDELIVEFP